jgi:hypothetical protein
MHLSLSRYHKIYILLPAMNCQFRRGTVARRILIFDYSLGSGTEIRINVDTYIKIFCIKVLIFLENGDGERTRGVVIKSKSPGGSSLCSGSHYD